MRHPSMNAREWRRVWLARYAIAYFLPMLVLFVIFAEEDTWYFILAAFWTLAVLWLAWRSADADIGMGWRAMLVAVFGSFLALTSIAVLAGPGSTTLCATRYIKVHMWARPVSIGPDPYCQGVPVG